jgi:hypothetical protein
MLIPVTVVGGGGGLRRDGRQVYLSMAQVHTIMAPPKVGEMARVTDLLGNDWEATEEAFDKVHVPTIGTLPAEKGTLVLVADQESKHAWYRIVFRYPVLGWIIDREGEAKPIIYSGIDAMHNSEWTVLHPNGSVESPSALLFDDEKDWLSHLNRRVSKKKERDLIG